MHCKSENGKRTNAETLAKGVVDSLIEKLQNRFHLEPEPKPRRHRAISASLNESQSRCFKQHMMCMIDMMLACPVDATPCTEDTVNLHNSEGRDTETSTEEVEVRTEATGIDGCKGYCDDDSGALDEMLGSVAQALTDNHQPQYVPAAVVHSTLSVYKTMTFQEFSFLMSDLRDLTPEQQVMYTHNQDVIDELCSGPDGQRQKSVYCYEIKKDKSGANEYAFETQYAVACSIDYIKKRFDLFASSRVLCCEQYVYLVADSEDLFIMSKVIIPYISLVLPIHKANYGSSNFLASPLVIDALATAPPRSKMVKYSMWMLATLLHRTSSIDPIDMLFNELVREGDEVLACLGRTYIIYLLGFQAQQRHDSVANHMLSNSHQIYFESPHSYEARNDAIRMKQFGRTSNNSRRETCDEHVQSSECQNDSDVVAGGQTLLCKRKRSHCVDHSNTGHHVGADTEDLPSFTEEDVEIYKKDQEDKCVALCAIKDMCLIANRTERWCISATALDRLIGSFEKISAGRA